MLWKNFQPCQILTPPILQPRKKGLWTPEPKPPVATASNSQQLNEALKQSPHSDSEYNNSKN